MNYIRPLFFGMAFFVGLAVSAQATENNNGKNSNPHDDIQFPSIFYAALYNHVEIGREILRRNPQAAFQITRNGMMPIHAATYGGNLDFIEFLVQELGIDHPFVRPSGDGETPLSAYDLALQGGSAPEVLRFFEELQRQRLVAESLGKEGRDYFKSLPQVVRSCITEALPLFQPAF